MDDEYDGQFARAKTVIILLMLQDMLDYPFFFFNDTATTEIYTLSLHDALPISMRALTLARQASTSSPSTTVTPGMMSNPDRKSTRLNSSHLVISYAVFCLKKKKKLASDTPKLL